MVDAGEKVCGKCKWHYAHDEALERTGFKNCHALPYPECTEFYSTAAAGCIFPDKFEAAPLPPINGSLNLALSGV